MNALHIVAMRDWHYTFESRISSESLFTLQCQLIFCMTPKRCAAVTYLLLLHLLLILMHLVLIYIQRKALVCEIVNTHIADSCCEPVNIDGIVRDEIMDNMSSAGPSLLDSAHKQVYMMFYLVLFIITNSHFFHIAIFLSKKLCVCALTRDCMYTA